MRERLDQLCQDLDSYAKSKCERVYVESLRSSCESLEKGDVNSQAPHLLTDEFIPKSSSSLIYSTAKIVSQI